MSTAQIIYSGQLRTNAKHVKSGNELITDAPTDNHGKGEAFSPTDLIATALGSCMLTVMGIGAAKNDIYFEHASAEIVKEMTSGPRRVSKVSVQISMPDHAYTPEEKARLEDWGRNCPVAKSLHPDLQQDISFIYQK